MLLKSNMLIILNDEERCMSLLDSKAYMGLSIKLFDDMFKAHFEKRKLNKFNVDKEIQLLEDENALPMTGHLEISLMRPGFELRERADGHLYTIRCWLLRAA